MPAFPEIDPLALAGAVISDPELPTKIPRLKNSDLFGPYAGIVNKVRSYVLPRDVDLKKPTIETTTAVRKIIKRTR
jgi:hypothetical protein